MHLDNPVILDLETSSLEADAGVVVGAGLITEKSESYYLESRRTGEERDLLVRLAKRLDEYPTIVTWNGRTFDLPFLVMRMLNQGLDSRTILYKHNDIDIYLVDICLSYYIMYL